MDNKGAVIIPPIIGAAMRLITSEPVPVPMRIGNKPARITATVIAFGRTRSNAPSPKSDFVCEENTLAEQHMTWRGLARRLAIANLMQRSRLSALERSER